jgi:hypothetical protein
MPTQEQEHWPIQLLPDRNRDAQKSWRSALAQVIWLILLFVPPLVLFGLHLGGHPHIDFLEIYRNSRHAIETGHLDTESLGFYPPSARSMLMLPALARPGVALLLVAYSFALLYWIAIRPVVRYAVQTGPKHDTRMWLYLAGLMGPWIAGDLAIGQLTSVVVFACVIGYVLWRKGYPVAAGLVLSFGIVIKVLPVVCLGYFVIKRQWRLVIAAMAFTLVLGLVPGMIVFGPSAFLESWPVYWQTVVEPKSDLANLTEPLRWSRPASFINPALLPTLLRWFTDFPQDHKTPFLPVADLSAVSIQWAYRLMIVSLAIVTFLACWSREKKESNEVRLATQYALVMLFMLINSPHLMIYFLAAAIWPIAVAMGFVVRRHDAHGRPDWINLALLWIWAISIPLSTSSPLRGAGLHPLLLLVMWAVMLRNAWVGART